MPTVNYNKISHIYDDVRQADIELITHFLAELDLNDAATILDIGCGTGNHTDLLQKVTHSHVYGIEPSAGMLSRARQKNRHVVFQSGDAAHIPFDDDYFDFVYMTDVIHHVPDINSMFAEIKRVLKTNGNVCIVTQSHHQIEQRPIVQFFPGTASVDKARYPDIDQIVAQAAAQSLKFIKTTVLYENQAIELGPEFLELVKKKGYSMLHLIADEEYDEGVKRLETELRYGTIKSTLSGETLVWFIKP
ncbi:MAG TPA: methyltransferase domain-containing protein [Anaerolineae bacterium]|nr:methyltransferase domain-containing protein [Anaerolineae bacterium]